jgi:hypothetical protein
MTETPAPENEAPEADEAIEAAEATDPEFVPNRQDRRGGAKKSSQNSKIPGQMHNNNVVGKRSFTNRRSG